MNYWARVDKPWSGGIHLWLLRKDLGKRQLAKLVWEDLPDEWLLPEPTFSSSQESIEDGFKPLVQSIIEQAESAGVISSSVKDKTDEIKAVKYHLEDMRKLVFK